MLAIGLSELTTLELRGAAIGELGARILANAPILRNVRYLDLTNNSLGAGVAVLVASINLGMLLELRPGDNNCGDAGAVALATCPRLTQLAVLHLDNIGIGDAGAQALIASPYLARVHTLHLSGNTIGDAGAMALAEAPRSACLRALELETNQIGLAGARALLDSPYLDQVTIDLDGNPCGWGLCRIPVRNGSGDPAAPN